MRLMIEAVDEATAREAVRAKLGAHGIQVTDEDLSVQETPDSASRGPLRRLFRRTARYAVRIEPRALRGLKVAERYRVATALDADLDGKATLRIGDDGIALRVFPPVGQSRRHVSKGEVRLLLEEKQIQDVDEALVDEIIAAADGQWHVIAERRPELDRDASVTVTVAEDGMSALLTLGKPFGGKPAGTQELKQALAEAGVVRGIDDELVQKLATAPVYDQPMVIARGQEPRPGKDGRVEFLFDVGPSGPALREDGTVDYREIGVARTVSSGDAIGAVHPPGQGTPGWDVTGKTLEASPGQPAKVRLGKGVRLIESTGRLHAARDGHIIVSDTIDVAPVFHVAENVDFSVGNIRFPGAVHIGGDVLEGFQVEAEGSIVVRGSVVGATVISYEGDVEVRQGIRGPGEVRVEAREGTIKARFVENAKVRSRELEVSDAILHSQVEVAEKVTVHRRDGRIAGGRIEAGKLIESSFVGSVHATRTELILRGGPGAPALGQPPAGAVRVRQICYPGTVISIGGARSIVREERSRVRFVWEDGAVKATVF